MSRQQQQQQHLFTIHPNTMMEGPQGYEKSHPQQKGERKK